MKIYIRIYFFYLMFAACSVYAQTPAVDNPPSVISEPAVQESTQEPTVLPKNDTVLEPTAVGKEETSFTWQLLNMLATLGLLLSVVFLASWALKRMMRSRMHQINESSTIKILEQRPLTTKSILSLVEIRGQQIALAESANGITLLYQFPTTSDNENL